MGEKEDAWEEEEEDDEEEELLDIVAVEEGNSIVGSSVESPTAPACGCSCSFSDIQVLVLELVLDLYRLETTGNVQVDSFDSFDRWQCLLVLCLPVGVGVGGGYKGTELILVVELLALTAIIAVVLRGLPLLLTLLVVLNLP